MAIQLSSGAKCSVAPLETDPALEQLALKCTELNLRLTRTQLNYFAEKMSVWREMRPGPETDLLLKVYEADPEHLKFVCGNIDNFEQRRARPLTRLELERLSEIAAVCAGEFHNVTYSLNKFEALKKVPLEYYQLESLADVAKIAVREDTTSEFIGKSARLAIGGILSFGLRMHTKEKLSVQQISEYGQVFLNILYRGVYEGESTFSLLIDIQNRNRKGHLLSLQEINDYRAVLNDEFSKQERGSFCRAKIVDLIGGFQRQQRVGQAFSIDEVRSYARTLVNFISTPQLPSDEGFEILDLLSGYKRRLKQAKPLSCTQISTFSDIVERALPFRMVISSWNPVKSDLTQLIGQLTRDPAVQSWGDLQRVLQACVACSESSGKQLRELTIRLDYVDPAVEI